MNAVSPFAGRANLVDCAQEAFRPPLLAAPARTAMQRLALAVRKALDVQFGTIFNDVEGVLRGVRGVAVDVGCGAQPFRDLFLPGVTYIPVDTAESEAHFGYLSPDTRYFRGSRLPVEDASADFVLCTETLEHIAEPGVLVAEISRILKPGGRALLTVPFASRWHFIPYDYWRYTPSSLAMLFGPTQFSDLQVYARGNAVTVACYKVMGCVLPLLLPADVSAVKRWRKRLGGLLLSPLFAVAALIANLSLLRRDPARMDEDCLGYSVFVTRSA